MQVQARDVASVAASPVDSNAPPQDQRKTFSRRKVVSNWEKYDEGVSRYIECTSIISVYIYIYAIKMCDETVLWYRKSP